jgi:alpha-L-arabinofuranosidase
MGKREENGSMSPGTLLSYHYFKKMKTRSAHKHFSPGITTALCFAASISMAATISVDLSAPGKPVPATLHGLFFEDINYAADGGLYAELVQNRSFEHRESLYSWSGTERNGGKGKLTVEHEAPLNANNLNFLRIHVGDSATGMFGAANTGFGGMALKAGDKYKFTTHVRRRAGDRATLQVALENPAGDVIARANIPNIGPDWKKVELTLTSIATVNDARLVLLAGQPGAVDVDMVSLFPEKTFKGRRNGLRTDLAQALADLKPGFMRFPGGCIVEGRDFANMYRWKDTIGDVAQRKQNWNLWQDRTSPQYSQTYGLGFFEYFLLCEDMGAEPMPVVNCGMCCQARRGTHVPLDSLSPYVQDALDLIEFANGPVNSEWGSVRAAMGHPKPFNMKMIGVGNEQWNQEYFDRYAIFHKAIKAKYPDMEIVSTSGPHPDDPLFKFAWDKFKSGTPAEVVDEHYYRPPQWFLENNHRYDDYDRKGPKVFAGEYAAHDGNRANNLRSAITEAAFATGLWRNSDVVTMTSYAPLFAKYGHVQWRPDLIWFDNTRVVLTPNYHVQALLGQHRPTEVVPVTLDSPVNEPTPFAGRIGVGTWRTQAEFKDIVVTKDGKTLLQSDFSKDSTGWEKHGGAWSVVDGALRQTSNDERVRAFAGDPSWTDYTLSLKARKISGTEGFLISFASKDPDAVTWWNIAGWENSEHGLEAPGANARVRGKIETNRWYDIRIELKGATVKCYIDDKLIQEAGAKPTQSLFASAGRDRKSGETIVAVANASGTPLTSNVKLAGIKGIKPNARAIVLTSGSPDDENTLEDPSKVKPREESLRLSGPSFEHTFPAWSFTVLRVSGR